VSPCVNSAAFIINFVGGAVMPSRSALAVIDKIYEYRRIHK
jgi:hypothetical protein